MCNHQVISLYTILFLFVTILHKSAYKRLLCTVYTTVTYIGFHFGGADYVFDLWVKGKEEVHYYEKNYFNTIRLLDCLYTIREIRNSIFFNDLLFFKS
jgi:hypothetical protein